MYFKQSYFDFFYLEMNLKIYSISEFLVQLTQLELTKWKQKVKIIRFSLKAFEIKISDY